MTSELTGRSVLVTGAAGCIGAWVVKTLIGIGARPIVYDLSGNQDRLRLIMDGADTVPWILGDITDYDALSSVISAHNISAIIHLAALQVPFCKADPRGSTNVNVMGSINILEAARANGIKRLAYASSVAAPAMNDTRFLSTLYGAHKVCGEQMAAIYWQDWQVPSVGIRPGIIYGPGRDQGMSAAPTIAMLAAFENISYAVPFSGPLTFVHVEDAAQRFVGAISKEGDSAPVFDMNGTPETVGNIVKIVNRLAAPKTDIAFKGAAMPFPATADDGELEAFIGGQPYRTLEDGIAQTLAVFLRAKSRGFDTTSLAMKLTETS